MAYNERFQQLSVREDELISDFSRVFVLTRVCMIDKVALFLFTKQNKDI